MTIAEKINFETNLLFFMQSLPKLLSCFFCSVQLSNLISRNFHYDAICNNTGSPNFSDVFSLNCIFVIDAAAVKQLVSNLGVSLNTVSLQ